MEAIDPADRLAYAYRVLLPIWERWTDGNPALRRFLECASADPASHEERLLALIRTSGELRRRGGTGPGVAAAGAGSGRLHEGVCGRARGDLAKGGGAGGGGGSGCEGRARLGWHRRCGSYRRGGALDTGGSGAV